MTNDKEYFWVDYDGDSSISILRGPDNFECCLTDIEDRTWGRDGKGAVDLLNKLYKENKSLKDKLERRKGEISMLKREFLDW